jgi:hypothetical protein
VPPATLATSRSFLLRSYSLVEDPRLRSQLLDVIDRLLEVGAYGIADAIDEARR